MQSWSSNRSTGERHLTWSTFPSQNNDSHIHSPGGHLPRLWLLSQALIQVSETDRKTQLFIVIPNNKWLNRSKCKQIKTRFVLAGHKLAQANGKRSTATHVYRVGWQKTDDNCVRNEDQSDRLIGWRRKCDRRMTSHITNMQLRGVMDGLFCGHICDNSRKTYYLWMSYILCVNIINCIETVIEFNE